MAIEKTIIIDVDASKGSSELKGFDDNLQKVKKTSTDTNNELNEVSKGALDSAMNFKVMGVSLNDVSKGLKLFKISLVATGIGAIVVVVGALAAAFLSTQEGVDKLNSVMIPLKEVMQTILGVAQKLGKGLMEMVSGDVQKGWKTMGSAVENVGDQMEKAWQNGTKLYNLQKRIREDAINDGLVISRLNRLYADQLEIAEDINKTVEERRDAFKAAIAAQEAITKLQKRENDNQVELAKAKTLANDTDDAAKKALNDLIAKGEDIESAGIKAKILLQKKLNVVKVEGVKEEASAKEEARKKVTGIETIDPDKELLRQKLIGDKKITTDRAIESEIARYRREIREEDAANAIETERVVAQAKADIQDATLNNISAGIGLLRQIAGKNKGLQAAAIIAESAMGIARIVIGTQAANAAVTAKYALIPGGIALATVEKTLNKVGAGIGIASNLLATKTALGALGQGGGGGSAPSISGGGGSAPAPPQFNIVGQNTNNQLAQSIGRQQSLPIEAYVVSGAVTSAQAMDRNRVKTATFN